GRLEHVANPARAHAHEHLNEFGAADRKERYARLSCHRASQQGLSGTGRPHQEHTFRDLGSQPLKLVRAAQGVNRLLQFALPVLLVRYFFEGPSHFVRVIALGGTLDIVAQKPTAEWITEARQQEKEEGQQEQDRQTDEQNWPDIAEGLFNAHNL